MPWLQRQRYERFVLISDPVLAAPFAALSGERFHFPMADSLPQVLDGLEALDIGLAPQLPTQFSRCRCDVRFLENANRSLLPALLHLDPYCHLAGTDAALLLHDTDERIHHLDRLAMDRGLAESTKPVVITVEPLVPQAAERPLTTLPGLRQLAPRPWHLGIDNPADQRRLRRGEALQRGALAESADVLALLHPGAARHYGERTAALNRLEELPQGPEAP